MKLTVHYESIDPYYSSLDQVFIGIDEASCYSQKDEFEEWLNKNHPTGIYKATNVQLSK